MTISERVKKRLKGFVFTSCAIRSRDNMSFGAQKPKVDDPMVTNPTGIFIFYPNKPVERQWACDIIGEATGIHGCAVYKPIEQWVYVMDDAEVFVVGQGDDNWQKRIAPKPAHVSNVKCIAHGRAYAVGVLRKVYRRDTNDKWIKLEQGLPKTSSDNDTGFSDIDGFSESDIYACGGYGDLWHYDGKVWKQIRLVTMMSKDFAGTSTTLDNICCGGDGLVYILASDRTVIVGRKNSWKVIKSNLTEGVLENLVWYQDRIYVSTVDGLYEVRNGKFQESKLKVPKLSSYANIASGDGILLVSGYKNAAMYDGKKWEKII